MWAGERVPEWVDERRLVWWCDVDDEELKQRPGRRLKVKCELRSAQL